jgi:hypothetical protein
MMWSADALISGVILWRKCFLEVKYPGLKITNRR